MYDTIAIACYKNVRSFTEGAFSRFFLCGEPFRPLVVPATLRSKTTEVGATQMTLLGKAIDGVLPVEG